MKFIDIKTKYLKKLLILVISFLIVSCEQYKLMNSNLSVSEDTDHLYVYDKSKNLIIIDQLVVDYEIKRVFNILCQPSFHKSMWPSSRPSKWMVS